MIVSDEVSAGTESASLSYKFQRLREKLRNAISSGELGGKLPGERALAKQFHVNAKTLSKALTDLAAEGLLDRSIGRGTYVKGSGLGLPGTKRWLLVCDPDQRDWEIVSLLKAAQPEMEIISDIKSLRPSFLNQFGAVLDIATNTPDSFVRDLVVRNVTVVAVGKEPKTFSTHAVVFDRLAAVNHVGRELMFYGHRKLAAIEPPLSTAIADALRKTAARYAPDATVDACFPADVVSMFKQGITAFVCQSVALAVQVKETLQQAHIAVPAAVSLVAIGCTSEDHPVSGFFLPDAEKARSIVDLLLDRQVSRPTTLWLSGRCVERGTTGPVPSLGTIHPDDMQADHFESVAR